MRSSKAVTGQDSDWKEGRKEGEGGGRRREGGDRRSRSVLKRSCVDIARGERGARPSNRNTLKGLAAV
jgi:hypothetical protein